MTGAIIYLVSMIATGYIAHRKKHSVVPCLLFALLTGPLAVIFVALVPRRRSRLEKLRDRVAKKVRPLVETLSRSVELDFQVTSCGRCGETEMELLGVSPNGRSVEYQCRHCQKRTWASAANARAAETAGKFVDLQEKVHKAAATTGGADVSVRIYFSTPVAPLPYERTTRESVPAAVRSEVWRRDEARCVECGSRENLEFDHIIPVSRGGSSSARNLQILCRSCNRTKAAAI